MRTTTGKFSDYKTRLFENPAAILRELKLLLASTNAFLDLQVLDSMAAVR